jgi:cytochrome c-type biogenesis protein CcmH
MTAFIVCAALMLVAALAFLLPTLMRGWRDHGTGGITLALAVALPLCAVLLYRYVGNPLALEPAAVPAEHQDVEQAIADLAAKLRQNPNDIDGWTLLGRAYEATERFAEARDALKHAHDLAPDDPDLTVAYAQALALASDSRRIVGEPRAMIEEVLRAAPDNERGLWLLGISDFQAKDYDAAIASWNHLLSVLPKDSDIEATVREEIAQAQAARGDGAAPDQNRAVAAQTAPVSETHLQVEVALDPKLKDKLAESDVLFVYAKAANGPPMPLAVQRLPASKLPVTVTLSDGMGMTPNAKLSQYQQVIVGARVSKTGNAIAQSGDLQTTSAPLAVSTATPIKLLIDTVVP